MFSLKREINLVYPHLDQNSLSLSHLLLFSLIWFYHLKSFLRGHLDEQYPF